MSHNFFISCGPAAASFTLHVLTQPSPSTGNLRNSQTLLYLMMISSSRIYSNSITFAIVSCGQQIFFHFLLTDGMLGSIND